MSREEPSNASVSASARGVTVEADGRVLKFDPAGRLLTVFDGDHVFRRGLDHAVVEKWWATERFEGTDVRVRRSGTVSGARKARLVESAYETARRVLGPLVDESLPQGSPDSQPSDDATDGRRLAGEGRESIRRVLAQSPSKLREHGSRFGEVYEPVGVLPPDQYNGLVLQPTTGCRFDCSFCTLAEGDLSVLSPDAFADHVAAVKSFLGRGLQSRRSVFLGEADPLAASRDRIEAVLSVVERAFPAQHAEGVNAWLTVPTAARTDRKTFESFAERGLRRVYVGVESGSPAVLELLGKPQTPEETLAGIRAAKSAGLSVGAMVLAGVGGRELADEHRERTGDLMDRLPLGPDDVVYVSPLVPDATDDYGERLQRRSLSAPTELEIAARARRLRSAIAARTDARVTRYHVDGFVYQ